MRHCKLTRAGGRASKRATGAARLLVCSTTPDLEVEASGRASACSPVNSTGSRWSAGARSGTAVAQLVRRERARFANDSNKLSSRGGSARCLVASHGGTLCAPLARSLQLCPSTRARQHTYVRESARTVGSPRAPDWLGCATLGRGAKSGGRGSLTCALRVTYSLHAAD